MTIKDNLEIANTIRNQIDSRILMCAGAHDYRAGNRSLFFTIQNTSLYRKAIVVIELNYSDTYNIKLMKPKTYEELQKVKGIYADELSYTLEGLWENKETLKAWSR
tara:strand:+ start:5727 stop:6044 length:318 start_codon:yes stop_codon:yes gene_type:complete